MTISSAFLDIDFSAAMMSRSAGILPTGAHTRYGSEATFHVFRSMPLAVYGLPFLGHGGVGRSAGSFEALVSLPSSHTAFHAPSSKRIDGGKSTPRMWPLSPMLAQSSPSRRKWYTGMPETFSAFGLPTARISASFFAAMFFSVTTSFTRIDLSSRQPISGLSCSRVYTGLSIPKLTLGCDIGACR